MNRLVTNLRGPHAVLVRSLLSLTLILIATYLCVAAARQTVSGKSYIRTTGQTTTLAKGQAPGVTPALSQTGPRSPSDTVREFYKAMHEKRFREAFSMSIYKPAIETLKPQEFEELRPDFERMAAVIPDQVNIAGEQVSGEIATVFVKVKEGDKPEQAEPVTLILVGGAWIIGDTENQAIVRKAGKQFFFNARINTHHDEVQAMLTRISLAELLYSQQHNGLFADLATLISLGLLPKDLEGTESTGYRFHVSAPAGGKSWSAAAEPARYGRTGRLSFYLDASGVRSSDVGGKPLGPVVKN